MSSGVGPPPAPLSDASDQPTLRVMRFYKPRLDTKNVLPIGPELAASSSSSGIRPPPGYLFMTNESDFALSSTLTLPDSFGNIYLGETFTAYISVLNHPQNKPMINTELSAKLQSPSDRTELVDVRMARGAASDRPNPTPVLAPSENLDMIVEHTVLELGTHTLRVTVKYEPPDPTEGIEPKLMRKFYRFSVLNPINLAVTCLPIRGNPFVEMNLRNTTQMDLLLESCDFIPEEGFIADRVGGKGEPGGAGEGAEGRRTAGGGMEGEGEGGGASTPMRT
ncbi:unnamed protein product, partial [Discosporangium mesarthrocarpum]